MKIRPALVIIGIVLTTTMISAQNGRVDILSHQEKTILNTDCKKNKTCDLKKVEYIVEDYRVRIGGDYNYGTRLFVRYETKSVKDLEKYVFVQFMKGCIFSSRIIDGQIIERFDHIFPRNKEQIVWRFPDWVIDTDDSDPVYSSVPKGPRVFEYRWNTIPNSFSEKTENIYGLKKPKTPQLYIKDHSGETAFYMSNVAKNISLQFKTCIFKEKDVPRNVPAGNVNFAEPISCYEWSSSWVYNHTINEFVNPLQIVSACFAEEPKSP